MIQLKGLPPYTLQLLSNLIIILEEKTTRTKETKTLFVDQQRLLRQLNLRAWLGEHKHYSNPS